jgi:hypothetical protein
MNPLQNPVETHASVVEKTLTLIVLILIVLLSYDSLPS